MSLKFGADFNTAPIRSPLPTNLMNFPGSKSNVGILITFRHRRKIGFCSQYLR